MSIGQYSNLSEISARVVGRQTNVHVRIVPPLGDLLLVLSSSFRDECVKGHWAAQPLFNSPNRHKPMAPQLPLKDFLLDRTSTLKTNSTFVFSSAAPIIQELYPRPFISIHHHLAEQTNVLPGNIAAASPSPVGCGWLAALNTEYRRTNECCYRSPSRRLYCVDLVLPTTTPGTEEQEGRKCAKATLYEIQNENSSGALHSGSQYRRRPIQYMNRRFGNGSDVRVYVTGSLAMQKFRQIPSRK